MTDGINKKLVELCAWFNDLDTNAQINVLEYLLDKTDKLLLTEEDINTLRSFLTEVVSTILAKRNNREEIYTELHKAGLNRIFIDGLIDYCQSLAAPFMDALIISEMELSNLENLCNFILEKIILYQEFEETPFDEFVRSIGFENDEESAQRALRFVKSHYLDYCNRKYSLSTIEKHLLERYNIPKDSVNTILSPLKQRTTELHMAHLLNQVNKVLGQLSNLSCTANEDITD